MQTILLVDDNNQARSILRANLQQAGFAVVEAADGLQAIKALKEQVPDLIVLDLVMPIMDGYKVLQMAKTEPATREVPVVVLSGKGEPAEVEKALKLGAADFLVKLRTNPKLVVEKVRQNLAAASSRRTVPRYLLAVKELVHDAPKLANDFELPADYRCAKCGNALLLELVPDFSHQEAWFTGHFICALCRP